MKVEAVIRPDGLNKVKSALEDKGFFSMTVDEVAGRGKQGGIEARFTDGSEQIDLLPKTKIELVVSKEEVDFLIEAIYAILRTGEVEMENIVVIPVIKSIKIRTNEIMTHFSLIEEASCRKT